MSFLVAPQPSQGLSSVGPRRLVILMGVPTVGCGWEAHLGGACPQQLLLLFVGPQGDIARMSTSLEAWGHPQENGTLTAGGSCLLGALPRGGGEERQRAQALRPHGSGFKSQLLHYIAVQLEEGIRTTLVSSSVRWGWL